ncbi:metalloregulator ArsR/SmtB family transcription factor [Cyanobacterium aponinum UTEX 3222]|nr:metalloregulator ArsR/SmtB family transcription factor [Cyanobacterium aponinum]WPF89597.1 metalloregulator ArsR/SmtB family transcription factor [Cyanobacterium aponinum AL20115]WRL38202.1 metalloregulator ArsR/SmtB family transcription factor [Cyanobacterium aponinum UTEX 3221]WRL41313.1 metalloregulator ArsR/SmtB family transcription factor [Cyanobacterium aponinum UTEX 3222]
MINKSYSQVEEKNNTQSLSDCLMAQMPPAALDLVADFFKVLSETSRLNIVCCLRTGSKNVTEIIDKTGLGQANVSKHLKILAQAGIVARTQKGINVYYQISNPFVFELCDLVCNSLSIQIQQQHEQLRQIQKMQNNETVN